MVDKKTRLRRASEQRLSRTFAALSDPSRRRIIELLREADELRVSDIAEAFSMSLNGVSKHLKVLERAELLERRVEGREHWFSVNWATLQLPYDWLHVYSHFWSRRMDALVEYIQSNEGDSNDR